jgi:hypothetical protein
MGGKNEPLIITQNGEAKVVIYRVNNDKVYILLITDGRRDMQTLPQRRLLEA